MNCEELNRRYGAPERIVFREGPQGTPIVALANQYGSAQVSLFGAQVLSYQPTGNFPVLYLPREISFGPDKADHGGIPVCCEILGCLSRIAEEEAFDELTSHGGAVHLKYP